MPTPLTSLFNKNSFSWNVVANQSFHSLKEAMCTTLVLSLPNFTNYFVLECANPNKGIFVVLIEKGRLGCPFLVNTFLSNTWENPHVEIKYWLFYTRWIPKVLTCLGNDSMLKWIIIASNIFWKKKFHPPRNRIDLRKCSLMIRRSFTRREKRMK